MYIAKIPHKNIHMFRYQNTSWKKNKQEKHKKKINSAYYDGYNITVLVILRQLYNNYRRKLFNIDKYKDGPS